MIIELIFSLNDAVGSLREALDFFKEQKISLAHIQSRPSLYSRRKEEKENSSYSFEFLVEFKVDDYSFDFIAFEHECMEKLGNNIKIMTREGKGSIFDGKKNK